MRRIMIILVSSFLAIGTAMAAENDGVKADPNAKKAIIESGINYNARGQYKEAKMLRRMSVSHLLRIAERTHHTVKIFCTDRKSIIYPQKHPHPSSSTSHRQSFIV